MLTIACGAVYFLAATFLQSLIIACGAVHVLIIACGAVHVLIIASGPVYVLTAPNHCKWCCPCSDSPVPDHLQSTSHIWQQPIENTPTTRRLRNEEALLLKNKRIGSTDIPGKPGKPSATARPGPAAAKPRRSTNDAPSVSALSISSSTASRWEVTAVLHGMNVAASIAVWAPVISLCLFPVYRQQHCQQV